MDNKFIAGLGKAVDSILLSIIWLVFCIPIFTIGASTTAFYYTVHKSLHHGRSYIWRSFWSSFKDNFKQSTLMWLIMMVVYVVLALDRSIMLAELENGGALGVLYYMFIVMTALAVIWNIYIFAYTARFENTKKAIMKNAAIFAFANPGWSILILALLIVAVVAVMLMPPLVFIVPSVLFLMYDVILERIFRKYMSEEDLEKEKENDLLDEE